MVFISTTSKVTHWNILPTTVLLKGVRVHSNPHNNVNKMLYILWNILNKINNIKLATGTCFQITFIHWEDVRLLDSLLCVVVVFLAKVNLFIVFLFLSSSLYKAPWARVMVYGLGHKVRRNGQLNLMETVCYPLDASPTNTGLTPPPTTNQYPCIIIPTDKVHVKLGERPHCCYIPGTNWQDYCFVKKISLHFIK